MSGELTAFAAYDTDWHIYLTCPTRGPLGFCTSTGPDVPFDAAAATSTLEDAGWRVDASGWAETAPSAEFPYTAVVTRSEAPHP